MSNPSDASNFDHVLVELRALRRLEALSTSVANFLDDQIEKIEDCLQRCQEASTDHQLLQQRIIEFENQKASWDASQKAETKRLFEIGEKLIVGWEQLEKERADLSYDALNDENRRS